MWTVLYMAFFMWLESLFVVKEGYRNAVLCGAVILAVFVWIKWKKCFLWLKKGYQRAGFQLVEKNSSMLAGDIIWLGMEFYFLIFLYFVPGIFGISKFVDSVSVFFAFINMVLIVMMLCDTKLDVVFTGERTLPPLFLRVMPVSLVISALSVPVCWSAREFGVKESAIAIGVMFLFFLELTCNLGYRFFLRKKRENDGEKTPPAEKKILKLTAWKYLWAALVIAGPFLFGSWGRDPISLLLFALNTVCMLLLFWKQRNIREKICGYLTRAYDGVEDETEKADDVEENLILAYFLGCWLLFGGVLPGIITENRMDFGAAVFLILFAAVYLLILTLQNPLYGFLTNTVGPTALRRRIPYVTIAACVYAFIVYPLPWTDSGRLSKLAAVGIVELACILAAGRRKGGTRCSL